MKNHTKKVVVSAGALALTIGVTWLFSLTLVNRDTQQAATRTSRDSRETLCTATTPQYCGRIVIRKDTVPDAYQDFYFAHDVTGVTSPVILDDDATLSSPSVLSNSSVLLTPFNGVFSVVETTDPNYETSIVCTDPSGGTTSSGSSASINILNGETVQCVFTNTRVIGQVPTTPVSNGTSITTKPKGCLANTWTQKADFGGVARQSAVGFAINGKGYIGTGYSSSGGDFNDFNDFWEYDPVANTWTQKANIGTFGRSYAVGFALGGKGYIGKGFEGAWGGGNFAHDFWEYNPATDTWTQKANLEGAIGNMVNSAVFTAAGKGYVVAGWPYTAYLREYNPATDTWTQKASLTTMGRNGATGLSIGNRGYAGTGEHYGIDNFFQDFWEYNPVTDSWTQRANFGGGPRADAATFSIGGKGYMGTGDESYDHIALFVETSNDASNDFWEYDPSMSVSGVWTQKANFGGGDRKQAVGFSIGTRGYIGTGQDDNLQSKKDFWEYCP